MCSWLWGRAPGKKNLALAWILVLFSVIILSKGHLLPAACLPPAAACKMLACLLYVPNGRCTRSYCKSNEMIEVSVFPIIPLGFSGNMSLFMPFQQNIRHFPAVRNALAVYASL